MQNLEIHEFEARGHFLDKYFIELKEFLIEYLFMCGIGNYSEKIILTTSNMQAMAVSKLEIKNNLIQQAVS